MPDNQTTNGEAKMSVIEATKSKKNFLHYFSEVILFFVPVFGGLTFGLSWGFKVTGNETPQSRDGLIISAFLVLMLAAAKVFILIKEARAPSNG